MVRYSGRCLSLMDWDTILQGDLDQQVDSLTSTLLRLQDQFVPKYLHTTKPSDQPWFGPQCKKASDNKHRSWLRYKRNPTTRNKRLHRIASKHMEHIQKWAIRKWENTTKNKLKTGQIGSKLWWNTVKEKQGIARDETIPPLVVSNLITAATSEDKANVLAQHFSSKMTVPDTRRRPPTLPVLCPTTLEHIQTNEREVEKLLRAINIKKATGPDGISPRLLQKCAKELSSPLTKLFNLCLKSGTWPQIWKLSTDF